VSASDAASSDGALKIGALTADELADHYGTPLYLYDAGGMRSELARLRHAVADFADIHFSIKANPNPAVVQVFVSAGAGLEIASGAEFLTALAAGCDPARILFAGPGKGEEELALAIAGDISEIHLESFEEIETVATIAGRLGRIQPVAIRINPLASAQGGAMRMGGRPAAFGFDEESVEAVLAAVAARPTLTLSGVHLFAGTQILDARVLLAQWAHAIRVAAAVARLSGRPLQSIDLGGGLGVPYHAGDSPLDLAEVRAGVPALREALAAEPLLRTSRVILEPGRFLTAGAGCYVSTVRSVKMSRGTRFVVIDGGMHHHLGASGNLGQIIKRDYPLVATAGRPAETAADAVPTMLVGPLCTPLDTLGRQTRLPPLAAGDRVAVLQSGAYGLTASPVGFLSHPTPAEVLVDGGRHRLIRPRGRFDAPWQPPCPLPAA
jgi:diaminopimelate decarboxylase